MEIDIVSWRESAGLPLLGTMTLLPLALVLAVWLCKSDKTTWRIATAGMALNLLLGLYLLFCFDPHSPHIQLGETWGIGGWRYQTGADGANVLFFPLTALLGLMAVLYQHNRHPGTARLVAACLLGYEAILIGAFSALNTLQFWFWCLLELLPVCLLTWHNGTGQRRGKALSVLLQYWGGGLLLVLAGFILLAAQGLGSDWLRLQQDAKAIAYEPVVFFLLFYGFAIRMPLFPFHAWFPMLAEHGTLASTGVFLVGIKLGVYALLRFILPLLPGAAAKYGDYAMSLGLLAMFYGATLALMQINLRRLLAFAVISHTGMLVVGAFCLNDNGLEGTLLLMAVYGLASAALLFCLGLLYRHTHSAMLPRLGGLFDSHSALASLFLIAALSTLAMPGTPGFDAAHQLLEGSIEQHGWQITAAVAASNVLAAAFLLWAFQRVFWAERRRPWKTAVPFLLNERIIAATLGMILLCMGFYTAPWINYIDSAVDTVREHYRSAPVGRHHE